MTYSYRKKLKQDQWKDGLDSSLYCENRNKALKSVHVLISFNALSKKRSEFAFLEVVNWWFNGEIYKLQK